MRKVKRLVNKGKAKKRVLYGAGDGIRTHDVLLGIVVVYRVIHP